ncbi:ABC-2 type transport system permease protein [Saccharicrinis carchari]|uniref:ABC-2 type transport system permease protein n=1 Tax=Saccharicrinis carchari TaxID=1168039 RepID=A0A521DG76_SACCC|nr:ABC transporter permease [Saccharicrinis carchari]SMO69930.1 ABC-2 type transport system permease protein [Saccharicrinis carchari]
MFKHITTGLRLSSRFFKEELLAIFKDTGALLILILALIIYPVIYGIAYKNEVLRNISVAMVDLDETASSRLLTRMVHATEELNVTHKVGSLSEAEQLFFEDEVGGVIMIPAGFEKKVMRGQQASVSIYSDAGYFLVYKQTLTGAMQSVGTFSGGVEVRRLMAQGATAEQALKRRDPVALNTVMLFNPAGGYNSFVIPGLIIVILQQTLLIGIGLLGGTDKERGRFRFAVPQALNRGGVIPVVLGKAGAYFVIYLINIIITQLWVYHWFNLPNKAALLPALALIIPFLLAVIFLGMALSTFFSRREHSILFVVFLSPIVLFLSGLSWPVAAIPQWLYGAAHLFPSTTMVPAWLRVRTMGAELHHVGDAFYFLGAQALIYFMLAVALYYWAGRRSEV